MYHYFNNKNTYTMSKIRYRLSGDIEIGHKEWIDKGYGISHTSFTKIGKISLSKAKQERADSLEEAMTSIINMYWSMFEFGWTDTDSLKKHLAPFKAQVFKEALEVFRGTQAEEYFSLLFEKYKQ